MEIKPRLTGRGENYERVPLERDLIYVAACQVNPSWDIDPKNPKPTIKRNLEHMLELCDSAMSPAGCQLMVFPEFTLTGYNFNWTREDFLNVAIEIPEGEEIQAICAKAKELKTYIVFGSHTREKEWPGHFFNTSVMVWPDGKTVKRHWKAYGGNDAGPRRFEWATTVHEVLDEFVKRYGWDEVWPVRMTPIGNIASMVCSESFAPERSRVFGMKGCEILCLCIGGGGLENGYGRWMVNFRAECLMNHCYGVYASSRNGGSMVVGPNAEILNQACDARETVVKAEIPIETFRKNHKAPFIRTELFLPFFQEYIGKYPPNLYLDYGVPEDKVAAGKLADEHARW
ncbi:nitrilase-related carbon-nitrogen hydrolase [Chloroflexota bacterium]